MSVVVLVITVVVAWALVRFIPPLTNKLGVAEGDWSRLEPFFALLTFAYAVAAGIVVLREFAESSDSRNLSIYQDIYEKIMSPEAIEARRQIYTDVPDGTPKEVYDAILQDKAMQDCVKKVLNQIDYFGFLVSQDWVTSDEMVGWLSPIVVKVWRKIGPAIEYELSTRPEEPDYYRSAFDLVQRCEEWRDRKYPDRDKKIVFKKRM